MQGLRPTSQGSLIEDVTLSAAECNFPLPPPRSGELANFSSAPLLSPPAFARSAQRRFQDGAFLSRFDSFVAKNGATCHSLRSATAIKFFAGRHREGIAVRRRFVTYYRVSTRKQGQSGLGLAAQRAAVANHLGDGLANVITEFTEVESGRRNDRPRWTRHWPQHVAHRGRTSIDRARHPYCKGGGK